MPEELSVSLPLLMAAVLISSGVAKLRHPDELSGWRDLGVPRPLQREWLLRLHPWGEIALGIALAVLGGVLGEVAAGVAVVLMVAYTALIVQVLRRTSDASCACFGEPAPVTRWTVARNAWLTVLALASAAVIWAGPLWGGAVRASFGPAAWVVAALAVAAVTVFLIVRHDPASVGSAAPAPVVVAASDPVTGESESEDELDYLRARTPAVPVTLADGTLVNLRKLAALKPILLLAVRDTCSSCRPVIDSVERYRTLLPEVDVRLLLAEEQPHSTLTSIAEPQTLHDPQRYVLDSIMDNPATPAAVLLGADGLLAGGPVMGGDPIEAFVDDIYESLHGERPEH